MNSNPYNPSGAWNPNVPGSSYQDYIDRNDLDRLRRDEEIRRSRPTFSDARQRGNKDYFGVTDEEGTLKDKYRLNAKGDVGFQSNMAELKDMLGGINLDTRGLDAIRSRALGSGPSPWAQMMLEKEGVERGARMDEVSQTGASAFSKALSSLGARGGVSAASKANLARKNMRDMMMSRQGVGRQGQLDRSNIGIEDERQRMDLLKGLPGMELAALEPQFKKTSMWSNLADSEAQRQQTLNLANRDYATNVDKFNLGAAMEDVRGRNKFITDTYNTDMQAWGAERTAQAQENSGK